MTTSANSERERPFDQWLDDLFWLAHPHFTSDDYGRFRDAIQNDVAELTSLRSSLSRKDDEIEGLRAERARLQEIVRLVIAERKNGVPNYDWFVDTVAEIFGERT